MTLIINHTYDIVDVCPHKFDRLYNMGLTISDTIKVKYVHWLNGPIVIETHGRLIALRREEIECLTLRPHGF